MLQFLLISPFIEVLKPEMRTSQEWVKCSWSIVFDKLWSIANIVLGKKPGVKWQVNPGWEWVRASDGLAVERRKVGQLYRSAKSAENFATSSDLLVKARRESKTAKLIIQDLLHRAFF